MIDNFKLELYFVYQYSCHPERNEGSRFLIEIIRFVQNDKRKFDKENLISYLKIMKRKNMKILNYRVILEKETANNGETAYVSYVPSLGISDYGDTVEETLNRTEELIRFHLECLIEEGERIPLPDDPANILVTNSQIRIDVPTDRLVFA